jgi:DNA-binding NarL/FixJ family response regulator
MTKPISVLLVEDSRVQRTGVAAMLARHPDLRLIAAVSKPDVALLRSPQSKPDVVLLDLGLPSHDSLRFAERVKHEVPDAKVIGMAVLPLQHDLVEFVKAGVSGFLLKDATLDDLLDTVRTVVNGADVLPPALTRSLFSQIANEAIQRPKRMPNTSARLTPRELEVIDLIAAGSSNKQIAQRLSIALYTVKSHVHNILEKLALRSRLELAAYARREPAPATAPSRPVQQS